MLGAPEAELPQAVEAAPHVEKMSFEMQQAATRVACPEGSAATANASCIVTIMVQFY